METNLEFVAVKLEPEERFLPEDQCVNFQREGNSFQFESAEAKIDELAGNSSSSGAYKRPLVVENTPGCSRAQTSLLSLEPNYESPIVNVRSEMVKKEARIDVNLLPVVKVENVSENSEFGPGFVELTRQDDAKENQGRPVNATPKEDSFQQSDSTHSDPAERIPEYQLSRIVELYNLQVGDSRTNATKNKNTSSEDKPSGYPKTSKKLYNLSEKGEISDAEALAIIEQRKNRFPCKHCSKTFSFASHLKSHVLIHTGVKPYSCKFCNKFFAQSSHLNLHLKVHTGERKLVCAHCNKTFMYSNSLKLHVATHFGLKPYTCEQCQKSFTQRSHLRSHMLTHTGFKPFVCEFCSKSFTRWRYLKKHHQTEHPQDQVFTCEECNMSFFRAKDLKAHQKEHKEVKQFPCDQCGKVFLCQSALKIHQMSHSGERPFSCEKCTKSFTTRSALKAHFKIHTGIKPFSCSLCPKSFTYKGNLTQHMARHK